MLNERALNAADVAELLHIGRNAVQRAFPWKATRPSWLCTRAAPT